MEPTKVTPGVTSANIPKPIMPVANLAGKIPNPSPDIQAKPSPGQVVGDAADLENLPVYDLPSLKAVPLNDPDFEGIKPKNPMHKLYWANRGHQGGIRVGFRQAQGFRLANKHDVLNCPEFMLDVSGQIVHGDRVLMVIGKNAYEGALLNNHNKGIRRVSKFGQVHTDWREDGEGNLVPNNQPTDVMQATLQEVSASARSRAKIQSFIPNSADIVGKLASDPSSPQKP